MIQFKLRGTKLVGTWAKRVGVIAKRFGMMVITAARWLHLDKRDCTGIAGMASLGAGASAIFWPAGLIAVGVVLLYVAHGGVSGIFRRGIGSSGDGRASGE